MPFNTSGKHIAVNIIHVFVLLNNLGWVGWWYYSGRKYGYSTSQCASVVLDGVEKLHFGIILSSSGFLLIILVLLFLNCDLRSFDVAIYAYKEVPSASHYAAEWWCRLSPHLLKFNVSCPK